MGLILDTSVLIADERGRFDMPGFLRQFPAPRPIIAAITRAGGLNAASRGHFFELRFGQALSQAVISFDYEIQGEGGSTLDFGFTFRAQPWKVELMRLDETEAARKATVTGIDEAGTTWFGRHLYSNADDAM